MLPVKRSKVHGMIYRHAASDAMGETGKGFGNYIVVIGIVETVALFVMAFSLGLLGRITP